MTKAQIFRNAHGYARAFFANARYPRHELRHKSYAEAFAYGITIEHAAIRALKRVQSSAARILVEGTREFAEYATDGRL